MTSQNLQAVLAEAGRIDDALMGQDPYANNPYAPRKNTGSKLAVAGSGELGGLFSDDDFEPIPAFLTRPKTEEAPVVPFYVRFRAKASDLAYAIWNAMNDNKDYHKAMQAVGVNATKQQVNDFVKVIQGIDGKTYKALGSFVKTPTLQNFEFVAERWTQYDALDCNPVKFEVALIDEDMDGHIRKATPGSLLNWYHRAVLKANNKRRAELSEPRNDQAFKLAMGVINQQKLSSADSKSPMPKFSKPEVTIATPSLGLAAKARQMAAGVYLAASISRGGRSIYLSNLAERFVDFALKKKDAMVSWTAQAWETNKERNADFDRAAYLRAMRVIQPAMAAVKTYVVDPTFRDYPQVTAAIASLACLYYSPWMDSFSNNLGLAINDLTQGVDGISTVADSGPVFDQSRFADPLELNGAQLELAEQIKNKIALDENAERLRQQLYDLVNSGSLDTKPTLDVQQPPVTADAATGSGLDPQTGQRLSGDIAQNAPSLARGWAETPDVANLGDTTSVSKPTPTEFAGLTGERVEAVQSALKTVKLTDSDAVKAFNKLASATDVQEVLNHANTAMTEQYESGYSARMAAVDLGNQLADIARDNLNSADAAVRSEAIEYLNDLAWRNQNTATNLRLSGDFVKAAELMQTSLSDMKMLAEKGVRGLADNINEANWELTRVIEPKLKPALS